MGSRKIGWLTMALPFCVFACTRPSPQPKHPNDPAVPLAVRTAGSQTAPVVEEEPSDPSDEPAYIEYRYFPSAKAALLRIVASTLPRIIGFGEYHSQTRTTQRSALSRFSKTLLPAISSVTSDVIVEALVPTGHCGEVEEEVAEQVKTDTERPETTEDETVALFRQARAHGVSPHYLTLTCRDHELIWGQETVDYLALLELISAKIASKTEAVIGSRAGRPDRPKPLITIYGGAVHNDLKPDPSWQSVSFAPVLAKAVPPGKYVEIDLIVPELIKDNAYIKKALWYPLYQAKVATDKVLLIKQSETAYILVFPKAAGG